MKAKYLLMSLMLLVLASCQDESLIENKPAKGIKVYATTNNNDATRLTFTEGDGVTYATWDVGDGIGLFSETQNNVPFDATATTGNITEFVSAETLTAKDGDIIHAYFPYYSDNGAKEIPISPLNSGKWLAGNRGKPFMYASGIVQNNEVSLQFKHLYAYIKLTLTPDFIKKISEESRIERINVISTEDIYLYGKFNLVNQELSGQKQTYKMMYCDLDVSSTITYYIPVLPQTKDAYIRIDVDFEKEKRKIILDRKAPEGGLKAGRVYSLSTDKGELVPVEEEIREALIAFYKVADGDNWTNRTNWCTDKPITEWYGIRIHDIWDSFGWYEIDLPRNNLKGDIEECLKPFYGLPISWIDWSNNNLYGSIPKEINQMRYLKNLLLARSNISGEIPEEIGDLPLLGQLSLEFTNISGSIPESLGNLKRLGFLHLSNTNLSGSIPNSICNLSELVHLEIGNNTAGEGKLSGEIPQNIGNLTNLQKIYLANNQLTGNLPISMSKLEKCYECLLYGNKLSGHIPPEVSNQPLFTSWIRNIEEQQKGYVLTYNKTYVSTDFSKDKEVTVLQKHTKR